MSLRIPGMCLLVAAALLAVAAAEPARDPGLSSEELARLPLPPTEPAPPDTIVFSHALHRKKALAECVDCHQSVADSRTAGASSRPTEADCFEGCHDPESERPNCGTCHTNATHPSATFPQATEELVFDHQEHLARPEVTCLTCHADAPAATTSAANLLPTMKLCEQCHSRELDRLACRYCHQRLPDLATRPPGEAVHKAGFFPFHGAWAVGASALCSQCHEQRFCADCHARTNPLPPSVYQPDELFRSFIHRGDFLGRHALEAAARPARCQTCHGPSFCSDCHERSRASFTGATFQGARSPHPPGYVRRGGGAFHGTDARINIQSCASCHDQGAASNCVDCHRTGGSGGDPHPPGWKRRNREEEKSRSSACVPCHDGG